MIFLCSRCKHDVCSIADILKQLFLARNFCRPICIHSLELLCSGRHIHIERVCIEQAASAAQHCRGIPFFLVPSLLRRRASRVKFGRSATIRVGTRFEMLLASGQYLLVSCACAWSRRYSCNDNSKQRVQAGHIHFKWSLEFLPPPPGRLEFGNNRWRHLRPCSTQ